MKNIYSKLNNNDGKTILMALFLLLVAVVVSVVVITAASTAAHQLSDNKEAQQAYLTVSSAAQLFRDEIENKEYKHTLTTYTPIGNAPARNAEDDCEEPIGKLSDILTEIAQIIESNISIDSSKPYKEATIKIKKSGTTDSDIAFDDVDVKFYIQQGYSQPGTLNDINPSAAGYLNITFEASGKGNDEYGYKMNLAVNITKTMTTEENTRTEGNRWYGNQQSWNAKTTKTTIKFGNGILTRDGINADGGVQ